MTETGPEEATGNSPKAETGGLGRNTAIMAIGTLLSRLTGFGRIFALGYAIDFSRLTDTYNIANNVPNVVYELIVGGVLAATLVPVFVQEKRRASNPDELWRSISAVATITAVALTVVSVAVYFTAPLIIDVYTLSNDTAATDGQHQVATDLLRLFVPQILFYGFISIATGVANAHRKFGPPMFAPILNNIVVIAVLLAFPHVAGDLSLAAVADDPKALLFLGLGTTAGVLAMALALVPLTRALSQRRLRWNWDPKNHAVRKIVRLSGWTLGLVVANQAAFWVTTVLANGDPVGFTAFLAAYTFFILPHGIFAVSVMSAVQPTLAEQWVNGERSAFGKQVVHGLRLVLFVIVPAGAAYFLLAHPIVRLALDHGAFTQDSANTTAEMLMWLAAGLPGFSAFLYVVRVFQAMTSAQTVFWLYVFENFVNIVTAVVLWDLMGVNGLALSHTIAYSVAAVVAGVVLQRRCHSLPSTVLLSGLWRITAASAAMALVIWGTDQALRDEPLALLAAAIISGTIVYLGLAKLVRLSEMDAFTKRAHRLLRGNRA